MPTSPEEAARSLRDRYEFLGPPVNPAPVVVDLDIKVVLRDWEPGVSGLLVRGQKLSTIGLNGNEVRVRRHFTLWHELGHYFLHRGAVYVDYASPLTGDMEREADRFAVEMLMPAEWVREWWLQLRSAGRMAKKFDVSESAMRWRLRELGLILPR